MRPCYGAPVLLALVAGAGVAVAQEAPADAIIPPIPLSPLSLAWPADLPAPRDAAPASVDLLVVIDVEGVVGEVTVVAGEAPHAARAVDLLRGTLFAPAFEDGVPIPVEVPVHLDVEPPPLNVYGTLHIGAPDGPPLPGVTVHLGDRLDVSGEDGAFGFRGVAPGTGTLTVDAGLLTVEPTSFTLGEGEALEFQLASTAPSDGVVVGTYRVRREEVVRRSLTAEELRTTPGTMGDPLRAITNLPGAVRTPLDAGWLLIRGGDPRDTGVYIDGVRVPLVYHLGGFTSVVHPGFVDRVDFFPGGQSARYGRSTAGVVDLVTRTRPEELEVRAGANIVMAGGYAAVPLGPDAGLTAGFRRSYLDVVLDAVPTVSDTQADIAPRFWDWQLRADVGPWSAFGLGYIDTIDASTGDAEQLTITLNTQRVHGAWTGELGGRPFTVRPYYAYELRHIVIQAVDQVQDRLVAGPGVRVESGDDGLGDWGWSAGLDATVDQFGFRFDTAERHGVFVSPEPYADVRWGRETQLILGLRGDALFATGQRARGAVSPRVSGTWPVRPDLTLVADAGVYHQPPAYDLLMGPPEGTTLSLERSWGGGMGARWTGGPFRVDLDAYGRRIENLTAFEEDGTLGQGDGLAFGVESMTRYDWRRLSGWVTASWTRSLRREGSGLPWRPSLYDQPVSLVLVSAMDLGRHWTLAGRWRYASGFHVPPSTVDVQAYDILRQTSVPLVGNDNGRLEPFHSLDLKLSRAVEGRHWNMEFYLDVQNVYWRRVAEPVITGLADVYNVTAYGFGLPTLPILGIEGSFDANRRRRGEDAPPPAPEAPAQPEG